MRCVEQNKVCSLTLEGDSDEEGEAGVTGGVAETPVPWRRQLSALKAMMEEFERVALRREVTLRRQQRLVQGTVDNMLAQERDERDEREDE